MLTEVINPTITFFSNFEIVLIAYLTNTCITNTIIKLNQLHVADHRQLIPWVSVERPSSSSSMQLAFFFKRSVINKIKKHT